jgi:3-hydroxypropanoate dehydrogenase
MSGVATAIGEDTSTNLLDLEYEQRSLDEHGFDMLFREARTHFAWQPRPVPQALLHELYDLAKLGPTAANSSPLRVVFLTTDAARARLLPHLSPTNVEKSRTAGAVALIAYDSQFYDELPRLFPHMDARPWFAGNAALAAETAMRNGSLQGGYFIMAARALGLDCGPMSGFDADAVNSEFFPDGRWKINFICNLGYGDGTALFPRGPRLAFSEACRVL